VKKIIKTKIFEEAKTRFIKEHPLLYGCCGQWIGIACFGLCREILSLKTLWDTLSGNFLAQ